jgi:hypothetical protein
MQAKLINQVLFGNPLKALIWLDTYHQYKYGSVQPSIG